MDGTPEVRLNGRCEVWDQTLRDGLSTQTLVSLGDKVSLFERMLDCGFRHLELTRFPLGDAYPQFLDAIGLLDAAQARRKEATLAVFGMGDAGIDEALEQASLFDQLHIPCFASDAYGEYAFGEDWIRSLRRIERARRETADAGVTLTVGLGTVFGCPLDPDHTLDRSLARFGELVDLGLDCIMIGDTAGTATPWAVEQFIDVAIRPRQLSPTLRFHFHDTFGRALLNATTVVGLGVADVDASLLGIGGEPHPYFCDGAKVNNGNCATEELLALHDDPHSRGAQLEAIYDTCRWLATLLDKPVFGRSAYAAFITPAHEVSYVTNRH